MVSRAVELLKFTPGGVSVTLQDWAYSVGALNVKNFGAVGNGSHDDTANIQACFDAAWGSYSAPRLDRYGNKPVYFPPGTYRVLHTLQISRALLGAWVRGAGSQFTTIKYEGAVPGDPAPYGLPGYAPGYGANATCLMRTNGLNSGRFEGFSLEKTGMADVPGAQDSTSTTTACFNWDWYNDSNDPIAGLMNNSNILFRDVYFKEATYGFLMSPNTLFNSQGDNGSFMNCGSVNVFKVICLNHGNNVNNVILGGHYKGSRASVDPVNNPGTPISCPAGNIPAISGVVFEDNDVSIYNTSQGLTAYNSLYSTDDKFIIHVGPGSIIGCRHDVGTGHFLQSSGPARVFIFGCSSEHGDFSGGGAVYITDSQFSAAPSALFTGGNPGTIGYKIKSPLTFSQLPSLATSAEGLELNISDANSASWGDPVTGSGSTHALVSFSGNHAQAGITFTSQPALNSTVTITLPTGGPYVFPFQNAYYTIGHHKIVNQGSGGTNGTQTLTVIGGTGTATQVSASIVGGQLSSINSVVVAGSYTVKPTNPASVTGAGLSGATVSFDMNVNRGPPYTSDWGVFRGATLAECLANFVDRIITGMGNLYSPEDMRAYVSGSVVTLVARYSRALMNTTAIAHSSSPAANCTHSGTLSGGTDPTWTVMGK